MIRWLVRQRRKMLFALLVLALFCAAAEIGARLWLAHYARRRYDVDINAYQEAPLVDDRAGWRWGGKVVFRGKRPVSEQKPPGVYRIITTGDSCCWGALVPANATFSAALERILRRRYGWERVEVLNAGVVGYNSDQVTQLVKDTLSHFAPDLIIYYGTGEVSDLSTTGGGARSVAPFLEQYQWLFFHSRAFLILNHVIRSFHRPRPAARRFVQNEHINDLQRAVEASGAKLLLVEYLYVDERRKITSDLVGVEPVFRAPVVHTYETFAMVKRPVRELILDQVHPSRLGHELIGRCLADAIIQQGWIASSEK
jgi:lysophospholipase L1-like esterase